MFRWCFFLKLRQLAFIQLNSKLPSNARKNAPRLIYTRKCVLWGFMCSRLGVDFPRNMRTANKPVSQMLRADSFNLCFAVHLGEEAERWQVHFLFSYSWNTEIMGGKSTPADMFTCTRYERQKELASCSSLKGCLRPEQFLWSCSPASGLQDSLCRLTACHLSLTKVHLWSQRQQAPLCHGLEKCLPEVTC